ncbi:hypothetical protein PIB30_108157, partial [Stylosanthes scabra]|nr:hypothetical protein [Stylosanthes scabra]
EIYHEHNGGDGTANGGLRWEKMRPEAVVAPVFERERELQKPLRRMGKKKVRRVFVIFFIFTDGQAVGNNIDEPNSNFPATIILPTASRRLSRRCNYRRLSRR